MQRLNQIGRIAALLASVDLGNEWTSLASVSSQLPLQLN